jgi:peptide/nickel transport system substrate-binding protein
VVDRLKVAIASEREGNDPVLQTIVYSPQFLPMYENLVRYDETTKYVPMLATSWEISPDLRNWTFNLGKGVQFHKGFGEFTAKDVVHTIQRHIRSDSVSVDISVWKEVLEKGSIEVVDDYKIVFKLHAAKLNMPFANSNRWYNDILSKAHFDKEGQAGVEKNPIGTGPYQYAERVLGSHVLYERVPYKHYRVTPDFPELQMFMVKEHSTRLAMILAGEVHMTALPAALEPTAVDKGMRVIPARTGTVPVYTMFGGNFYPDKPSSGTRKGTFPDLPYSDVFHPVTEVPWVHKKVREALNRSVNRKEIQATVLAGKGQPMPVPFFHSALPGWNQQWLDRFEEKYGYDPKRAKELLKEVEAEIGQPLDWSKVIFLLTIRPELPELVDVAEAIANYWIAIGANVKLEEREFAYFRERIVPGRVGGVAWTDATIRFEDPDILRFVYYSHRTLSGPCCHFFENDTIDTLYEKLVPETDLAKRDQYLREAGNYAFEQYHYLPLLWLTADFTVNPKVIADYPTSGIFGMRDLEYVVAVKK